MSSEPVAETDSALTDADRRQLAGLLSQDIDGCRAAIGIIASSRSVDTMMTTMLDAVSVLSQGFTLGWSRYQRQRDALRRRRAGRRRVGLVLVAGLFVLFNVFADKALDASWPTAVVGSALLGLALWLVDLYRGAAMERRTWRRRLALLQDQVIDTGRYLVALRTQQDYDVVDRRLRGEPPRELADWSRFC